MRNNVRVNDVPKNPVTRAAKMARLPIGLAGRTALGVGKRIGGRPAEMVAQEIQQRTADQIFRVLGELKGGAMKLGQALSIFEAAMPPEIAAPYRATLTKVAGVRAAAARSHRAPGAGERTRRRLAEQLHRVHRHARRRGVHRPGARGRLATTASGSR